MSDHDSIIGKQLDEYRLEKQLGRGGMASVYRAIDTRLKRHVAIKVITAPFRGDSDYIMRFEREAQAVAQLDHPNIITLYRYGEVDNLLYMAMQYIDGADLLAVIESYHADGEFIEPQEIVKLVQEMGLALDYAHSKGVIHRDIKPSNIMINQQGHAIVVDFGLALLTELGTQGKVFGSPRYIAPEQAISSAGVVPQSDLYSVGVMLYEMFTGRVPFDAEEPLDIAMKHLSEQPPKPRDVRPELSPEIEAVLLKALAKSPSDRYPTGAALAEAVRQAVEKSNGAAEAVAETKPHHATIPERVALEVAQNPLPPLPGVLVEVPPPIISPPAANPTLLHPPRPSAAQQPAPSRQLPVRVLALAGLIGVIGLLALAVMLMVFSGGNLSQTPTQIVQAASVTPGSTQPLTRTAIPTPPALINLPPTTIPAIVPGTISPPTALVISTMSPATQMLLPTIPPMTPVIEQPTVFVPTVVVMPTTIQFSGVTMIPAPREYILEFVWLRDDSLFIINRSEVAFPLGRLRLESRRRDDVNGQDWEVDALPTGACVAVWRRQGNPRAADSDCELVGERLNQHRNDIVWRDEFEVIFDGEEVTTCEDGPCIVAFSD